MSLVLAIEPNAVQADTLRRVLSPRADTDVVVVGSTGAAVTALDQRVPDLVLVGALLSSRDEDALIAHLRTLPDAGHLQTLTIPQLRQQAAAGNARRGLAIFGRRKKRQTDEAAGGCDATQFGDEVAAYLGRACEVKAEIEQHKVASDAAAELDRVRAEAPQTQTDELATPEERRRADIARLETDAAETRAAAAREAQTATAAQTDETIAAERDRVRADAERTLAAELAAAEERHRADIARLETEGAEKSDAVAREAQVTAVAQANETIAAERERVQTDAHRTLAAQLAVADERHRAEIARLETDAAESRDAASRDAQVQADNLFAAERNRAAAEAELKTLAAELAVADERHHAEIARLETEAAESLDTQAAAETHANETLTAELDRVCADAERTLAAELATAEERHRAEIARLETEAESRDARVGAEAQADDTLAAERDPVRTDAGTLVDELAAAQARHYADIARREADAAEKSHAGPGDAEAAAEALADDTLAAERDRVRAGAVRTLAAQLAEAEERHRADIARLEAAAATSRDAATQDTRLAAEALAAERDRERTEDERTLAAAISRLEIDATEYRANIARLETEAGDRVSAATRDAQAAADRDPLQPLEPIRLAAADSSHTPDYYSLWRARSAAYAAPLKADVVARPPRGDPRRRRWALSVAATVLILLTSNPESGSAPRQALATVEAAGEGHPGGPTSGLDHDDTSRAPTPGDTERDAGEPASGDNPKPGVSSRAPLGTLALEIICVLVVMLLLRVTLFIGEGLVWRGLIVTLGLILMGFVVMRAPWGG